jgi:hypothetical protein
LIKTSNTFRPSLEKWNTERFGPVEPGPAFQWSYRKDNNRIYNGPKKHDDIVKELRRPFLAEETERMRQQDIQRELARLDDQILAPFYKIQKDWAKIR